MRADFPDIPYLCIRHAQKHMIHTDDLLAYDIQLVLHKKVIDISHDTCSRILNRKYRIIGLAMGYILHSCPPCFYMVAFDIFPKVLPHSRIAVGSLYTLEHNRCVFKGNMLHSCEIALSVNPMLCQQLVLSLTADGHDLTEKLLHAEAVKVPVGLFFSVWIFWLSRAGSSTCLPVFILYSATSSLTFIRFSKRRTISLSISSISSLYLSKSVIGFLRYVS